MTVSSLGTEAKYLGAPLQCLGAFSWLFAVTAVDFSASYKIIRRIMRHMEIDSIDRRILEVLQKKGRISNAELSEVANLSASACHRRVQRLEKDGYIRDYVALLNPRKVGRPTTVFVEITLSGQADEVLDAFERAVARVPDVLECHLMAGTADYLLKVVAGDTEDFARIHRHYLAALPGVAQMQSSFALRTVRQTTAMPV
jgi:Lrp/AsnC family leucine-responsive transcriptional regulator